MYTSCWKDPISVDALTGLVGHDLFLTFEMCFELEKNVSKGFPWHVGMQSFGYQFAEEPAYTRFGRRCIPVDPEGQRGGMAYVPENIMSGYFAYRLEPVIVSTMEAKERAGVKTNVLEYFKLRNGILNSPTMLEVLEAHQVEDDFQPGDALLFNKNVVHRSIMLGEGPLPKARSLRHALCRRRVTLRFTARQDPAVRRRTVRAWGLPL